MAHRGSHCSRLVVAHDRHDSTRPRSGARLTRALAATLLLAATAAPASVFYKFNVVAETPTNGFVSFGTGPSVNEKGKVAFVGRIAANTNESIYVWDPVSG